MVREEVAISLRELAGAARQDSFYLFLGAAFVTVALLALGALVVRRRRDPLLAYFSLFAGLYGVRLIMQRSLVGALFSEWEAFPRIREAISYLVPVPALFFFQAAGFGRYLTRYAVWGFAILGSTLFTLTLTLGSYAAFTVINNVAVLGLLLL